MKNIIDRASVDIFSFVASSIDREIVITVKHYEIYNEKIFDLTQPREETHDLSQLHDLQLLKGADGMVQIRGLNEVTVNNVQDIDNVISTGQKNRQVAETKANSHSSRSHAILEVSINNEPMQQLQRPLQNRFARIICKREQHRLHQGRKRHIRM